MKNRPKMGVATVVAGLVVGGLAFAQGFPMDRVLIAAGVGAAVMFGLLIVLRYRP